MHSFLICIHDATPAHASEIRGMLRDLEPLVGRRLSLAVVPNWHGEWPLASHPDFCRLIHEGAEELLLHGYYHRRQSGWGATTLLAEGCDEMNGLDRDDTRRTIEHGQRVFADVFGGPARGFLAPGWQLGRVHGRELGFEYVMGFFSLESSTGRRVPLATWTWDCGRWSWLGVIGHAIGHLRHSLDRGIPTLAIHPRDVQRGFWPTILQLTRELLDREYVPATIASSLEAGC
jgi:peptidoglycan/xylan/chitin deacetylase (PgdA/CDA1 family)